MTKDDKSCGESVHNGRGLFVWQLINIKNYNKDKYMDLE